jgi:ring-1,2-phenylacetyl-CoA epoxidase subunit PaaD
MSAAASPGVDATSLVAAARSALAPLTDPEIPVLTLDDLGIIREIALVDGRLDVAIMPTYSGCPATAAIRLEVEQALAAAGLGDARVRTVLSPAWSTDFITAEGRRKLLAYGIAPPPRAGRRALFGPEPAVACPRCGATDTEKLSEFGSTACKAYWRCRVCREPFDAFKCL